uniref:Uncharacterized protein n=1 Tax=Arundo donax TaxID=35708 RepID=A0A0A9EQX4_ARUDO
MVRSNRMRQLLGPNVRPRMLRPIWRCRMLGPWWWRRVAATLCDPVLWSAMPRLGP